MAFCSPFIFFHSSLFVLILWSFRDIVIHDHEQRNNVRTNRPMGAYRGHVESDLITLMVCVVQYIGVIAYA